MNNTNRKEEIFDNLNDNNIDKLRDLLKNCDSKELKLNDNISFLSIACMNEQINTVKLLIEKGLKLRKIFQRCRDRRKSIDIFDLK